MINIKAQEQYSALLKKDVFIMQPQGIYSKMDEDDTMTELRHETGLPNGVIRNALSGIRSVIKAFVCNGHSVYLPGLGTFRYSVKGKACEKVEDVSSTLIETRKLIFIPDVKIKQDLADTSISITCYDKNGKVIKKTTSTGGVVDDGDDNGGDDNGGDNGGSNAPAGGDNNTPGGGDTNNTGGGGTNTGGGGTQTPTNRTITYKHQGATYTTQEYAVGAAVTAPSAPAGYQWMGVPTVMPDRDMEITSYADGGDDMDL